MNRKRVPACPVGKMGSGGPVARRSLSKRKVAPVARRKGKTSGKNGKRKMTAKQLRYFGPKKKKGKGKRGR